MVAKKKNKAERIKNQLADALKSKDTDFGEILSLSHQLADEDDKHVRFSVDASHIDRLGRELVARQETAVAELVKNTFDADASSVTLLFENAKKPGGTLKIIDNGHGMTREELVNGFMRLSTQDKVDNPESRKYARNKAGRKGIGRFAAQRLGSELVLRTQTRGSDHALKVRIDWDEFVGHEELFVVANEISEVPLIKKTYGTILEIMNLREAWSDEQIRRTYRYISDLLQPFPLSKRRRAPRGKRPKDPGFKAEFKRCDNGKAITIADEATTFFDHAMAVFDAYVDDDGRAYWSATSKKIDLNIDDRSIGPDKTQPEKPYKHLRGVYLRAYYFLEDVEDHPYPQNLKSTIRNTLQDQGGLRLYRNGFRVPPYGSNRDDWLKLDWSYRRRLLLPQHGNNNFLGFIEISDPNEKDFEETSSREGLLENDAFRELVDFGYQAATSGVLAVAEIRGVKRTTSDRPEKTPKQRAAAVAKTLKNAAKREKDPKAKRALTRAADQVVSIVDDVEEQVEQKIDEISMLRVLAGMGLSIGEFTHEARFLIGAMGADIKSLSEKGLTTNEYRERLRGLNANFGTLSSYVSYFDRAVTENAHRIARVEEVRNIVVAFEKAVSAWLEDRDIELETHFEGYELFTCPMHPSEWSSIFMNLCTNAVKAVQRTRTDGRLRIEGGEAGNKVYIEFADNGAGIPESIRDNIYNAFFTTTSPSGPTDNPHTELVGTGLGLKIVRDIITSYGGTIALVDPPDGFVTCFRVEVPRASEDEIPEDAY